MLKNKESQANQVQELRNTHLAIEAHTRNIQRDFVEKDSEHANKLTAQHHARRLEHVEAVRKMIESLNANLKKVTELQDLEQLDGLISHYKERIDDIEQEIEEKDGQLNEMVDSNHGNAVDVDAKRNARSDFETQNLDLVDLRTS